MEVFDELGFGKNRKKRIKLKIISIHFTGLKYENSIKRIFSNSPTTVWLSMKYYKPGIIILTANAWGFNIVLIGFSLAVDYIPTGKIRKILKNGFRA